MFSGPASAGFLDKVAKAVTAPVKTILHGDIKQIPNLVVNQTPIGTLVDKAANTIGGTVGGLMKDARAAGPVATMNLTNVQFVQSVMAIKEAKALGIIKNTQECHQLAGKVATAVGAYAQSTPELKGTATDQGAMTQMLGDAACDTAIPGGPSIPQAAQQALPTVPGFGNNNVQIRPIAQCTLGPNPFFQAGGFLIMSDLTAANWNPMMMQWFPVAQFMFDGTGAFYLRGPGPGQYQLLVGYDGQLFATDMFSGQVSPPLGQCV